MLLLFPIAFSYLSTFIFSSSFPLDLLLKLFLSSTFPFTPSLPPLRSFLYYCVWPRYLFLSLVFIISILVRFVFFSFFPCCLSLSCSLHPSSSSFFLGHSFLSFSPHTHFVPLLSLHVLCLLPFSNLLSIPSTPVLISPRSPSPLPLPSLAAYLSPFPPYFLPPSFSVFHPSIILSFLFFLLSSLPISQFLLCLFSIIPNLSPSSLSFISEFHQLS